MPTYDYQCRNCGNTTEVIHSMLEEGPTTCEVCGGPLRRVLYPAGIIFKGSGFYKTDSRSSSSSTVSSTSAKETAKPAASSKDGSGSTNGSTSAPAKKNDTGTASTATTGDSSSGSH